ncbi:MAG: acyltransferase [Proteobacteria bacterium]|nr:acyltransferase [Pseudomonadota bacterium]
MLAKLRRQWERFWMSVAGLGTMGRIATRLAAAFAPPYMARFYLARVTASPYVDPSAIIHHGKLELGSHAFIADRVIIYQAAEGGRVIIGDSTHLLRDSVLETGQGGNIEIGTDTFLHPRCQVMAYKGDVTIGDHVAVAPNCAFYAYNHGTQADELIKRQPLETRGGISIGDGAWLGFGVIVLDGVCIGAGAIIGAGSVVTDDIPANAIAVGNPARVVSKRGVST